jgi:hypothetical protein
VVTKPFKIRDGGRVNKIEAVVGHFVDQPPPIRTINGKMKEPDEEDKENILSVDASVSEGVSVSSDHFTIPEN